MLEEMFKAFRCYSMILLLFAPSVYSQKGTFCSFQVLPYSFGMSESRVGEQVRVAAAFVHGLVLL